MLLFFLSLHAWVLAPHLHQPLGPSIWMLCCACSPVCPHCTPRAALPRGPPRPLLRKASNWGLQLRSVPSTRPEAHTRDVTGHLRSHCAHSGRFAKLLLYIPGPDHLDSQKAAAISSAPSRNWYFLCSRNLSYGKQYILETTEVVWIKPH